MKPSTKIIPFSGNSKEWKPFTIDLTSAIFARLEPGHNLLFSSILNKIKHKDNTPVRKLAENDAQFILISAKYPAVTLSNEEIDQKTKDLYHFIIPLLPSDLKVTITTLFQSTDTQKILEYLFTRFAPSDIIEAQDLQQRLSTIVYKSNQTMRAYLDEILELKNGLPNTTETDCIAYILSGIERSHKRSELRSITSNIQITVGITLEEVCRRLHVVDRWISTDSGGAITTNATTIAPIVCQICQKKGHAANVCYFRYQRQEQAHHPQSYHPYKSRNNHSSNHKHYDTRTTTTQRTQPKETSSHNERTNFVTQRKRFTRNNNISLVIDSGTSISVVNDLSLLSNTQPSAIESITAGGASMKATHVGQLIVRAANMELIFQQVHFFPLAAGNFLSTSDLADIGGKLTISAEERSLYFGKEQIPLEWDSKNKMLSISVTQSSLISSFNSVTQEIQQARLGFPSEKETLGLTNLEKMAPIQNPNQSHYYWQGHQRRKPIPKEGTGTDHKDLVLYDFQGPFPEVSLKGNRYALLAFKADNNYSMITFWKHKEADAAIKSDEEFRLNHGPVKILRTDNDPSFLSKAFATYLNSRGTTQQTSGPYRHEPLSLIEKRLEKITRTAICLLSYGKKGLEHIESALYHANLLANITSGAYKNEHGYDFPLQRLRILFSVGNVYIPKEIRRKYQKKSCLMYLTRISLHTYEWWNPDSNSYFESNDVIMNETTMTIPREDGSISSEEEEEEKITIVEPNITTTEEDATEINADTHPPQNAAPTSTLTEVFVQMEPLPMNITKVSKAGRILRPNSRYTSNFISIEPRNIKEINQMPEETKGKWQVAIDKEISTLLSKSAFVFIERSSLTESEKIFTSKWVFKIKKKVDEPDIYKARVVIRGFEQRQGVDYFETFAPTVNPTTVKIFHAICFLKKLEQRTYDIKGAYLDSTLAERILMEIPEGANIQTNLKDPIILLQKSLYGLRQSCRNFYLLLKDTLLLIGFTTFGSDNCLYKHREKEIYVLTHVDDIKFAHDIAEKNYVEEQITKIAIYIEITPIISKTYLGLKYNITENNVEISKRELIEELIIEHNLINCNPKSIPLSPEKDKINIDSQQQQQSPTQDERKKFNSIIMTLAYYAEYACPEITYSVHRLCTYLNNPTKSLMAEAIEILKYLSGCKYTSLTIAKKLSTANTSNLSSLTVYTDASWAPGPDRKSGTGYIILLNGCPIKWKTKKQKFITLSSVEAELAAIQQAMIELIFLIKTCLFFNIITNQQIYTDSQGSYNILLDKQSLTPISKHSDIKIKWMKEKITKHSIKIEWIKREDNIADIFTHALPKHNFEKFTKIIYQH